MKLSDWLGLERGRSAALALKLNIKPPQVAGWISGDKPVPVRHMAAIEAFTGGAVTRKEMCPDHWQAIWPELAPAHTPSAQVATDTVADPWDGIERRHISQKHPDDQAGRRETDRPDGFPSLVV